MNMNKPQNKLESPRKRGGAIEKQRDYILQFLKLFFGLGMTNLKIIECLKLILLFT